MEKWYSQMQKRIMQKSKQKTRIHSNMLLFFIIHENATATAIKLFA